MGSTPFSSSYNGVIQKKTLVTKTNIASLPSFFKQFNSLLLHSIHIENILISSRSLYSAPKAHTIIPFFFLSIEQE